MDRAFRNEMDALVNKTDDAFNRMMWREGIHSGFFAMQLLRDFYRWAHGAVVDWLQLFLLVCVTVFCCTTRVKRKKRSSAFFLRGLSGDSTRTMARVLLVSSLPCLTGGGVSPLRLLLVASPAFADSSAKCFIWR